MERRRPRLLRTYGGRRGLGAGQSGGGRACLRRVWPSAPWLSPPADPRRFFSSSSASSLEESRLRSPPPPPPPRRQPSRRAKKGPPKENRPPARRRAPEEHCPPSPSPLCRNVTRRRPPLRLRPPLLCSTPQQPLRAVGQEPVAREEPPRLRGGSTPCLCCSPQEALREDGGGAPCHGLPKLSLLNMDGDAAGSLELFSPQDAGSLLCQSPYLEPQVQTPATPHGSCQSPYLKPQVQTPAKPHGSFRQSSCVLFQSRFALPSGEGEEAPLEDWGGPPEPSKDDASPPSQCLQEADPSPKLPASPKTHATPPRPLQGAFQLQVSVSDGKIALSLPKIADPLGKRPRMSVQAGVTPCKRLEGLNGVLSDKGSDFSLAKSSRQLQPVVILDNQVVPHWLASKCSGKQVAGPLHKKEYASESPCAVPGMSDIASNSQVVPTCGEGATGRKACISGFSSRRWGQQRKCGQGRRKKNTAGKGQLEPSLLQDHPKWNEMEDDLTSSLFLDGSPVKNCNLWRRIRASLSLHKKKKILSEAESLNSSKLSTSSDRSPSNGPTKSFFTRKLGYSICPSSSMVLLSSMTSFSIVEVMLTDAEKVYGECQQEGPISFEECIPGEKMQKCEKIGEGVFGEVFKTDGEKGAVALKIIPIEGTTKVNGEAQKTFSEILPEIIISKELSLLAEEKDNQTAGFISLYSVHCVRGAYPERLLKAWDDYDRRRESENDRPDFFGDQQLFMVLEFEFGGTDLENMRNRQLNSVLVAKSILHQVTASLAVAEEALQFEHRDLHWGNVLVKKTPLKELSFKLKGERHTLPTHGVLVNIIDYTFSRLEKDGLTVYCDLSTDEEVFQGRGDYQFDIYRQMREENLNSWADYFPHSNILWLHYLVDKLLKEVSYRKKPTSSCMRQVPKQLELFSKQVLGFCSATELLNTSTFFH